MSEYADQRLAEIRANSSEQQPHRRGRPSRLFRTDHPGPPIELRKEEHQAAHNYIKQQRRNPKTPHLATWFDVHDAFVAGWRAKHSRDLKP